jgi:hypothetical protein
MKNVEEGSYYRLRKAMKYWGGWGCTAKVIDLETKYPDLLRSQQPNEIFTLVAT